MSIRDGLEARCEVYVWEGLVRRMCDAKAYLVKVAVDRGKGCVFFRACARTGGVCWPSFQTRTC